MFFLVTVLVVHLAQLFHGLICVLAATAIVRSIDSINFRGVSESFNFLFLVLIAAVLFLLFSGFGNRFRRSKVGRLGILILKLGALDP